MDQHFYASVSNGLRRLGIDVLTSIRIAHQHKRRLM